LQVAEIMGLRGGLRGIAAALAALLWLGPAAAAWPERPVRWIVAYPAGAGTDIVARLLGQRLSERLGKPVVVENKPGAGGAIGLEAVANATPDGYTLGMADTGPLAITRRSTSSSATIPKPASRRCRCSPTCRSS